MLIKYWYMHACRSKLQYFNLQGIIIFLHRSVGQQICEWKIYHYSYVFYCQYLLCYVHASNGKWMNSTQVSTALNLAVWWQMNGNTISHILRRGLSLNKMSTLPWLSWSLCNFPTYHRKRWHQLPPLRTASGFHGRGWVQTRPPGSGSASFGRCLTMTNKCLTIRIEIIVDSDEIRVCSRVTKFANVGKNCSIFSLRQSFFAI